MNTEHVSSPVRNIFSRAALKMLNACARFVYQFAPGFGIRFGDSPGSAIVSLNTESEALKRWVADQSHNTSETAEADTLASGALTVADNDAVYAQDEETWNRGEKPLELYICCRHTDGGNEGALFFRRFKFDRLGHVVLVDEEKSPELGYGAVVTSLPYE